MQFKKENGFGDKVNYLVIWFNILMPEEEIRRLVCKIAEYSRYQAIQLILFCFLTGNLLVKYCICYGSFW